MGRGNCCTFGKHEGLFYVDNDYLDVFSRYIEEDDAWESRLKGELDFNELTDPAWGYDDSHREIAPLEQAEDAVLVDCTEMTIQETTNVILALWNSKAKRGGMN